MPEFDLVILYSGGADSLLMLKLALELNKKPFCILIDYGQKHIDELEYAKQQLEADSIQYQVVSINGLNITSGLTGNQIPDTFEGVHSMNVPGRNTMFIAIAYSIAENKGISEIWYGADFSDRLNLFPDCYQEYVVAMNKVLEIAPSYPIKLYAPLMGWTKEMVVDYLRFVFDINMENVYSGYTPPKSESEN